MCNSPTLFSITWNVNRILREEDREAIVATTLNRLLTGYFLLQKLIIITDTKEFTRSLVSSNRWKYERKNGRGWRVPWIQSHSRRKCDARATIALTHQLHLVTNVSVTNRNQRRRFVVNQSVNCVSAFSLFPQWRNHFSQPAIYISSCTAIHSSHCSIHTPARRRSHVSDTRFSLAKRDWNARKVAWNNPFLILLFFGRGSFCAFHEDS